jgi:phage terminase small subunit
MTEIVIPPEESPLIEVLSSQEDSFCLAYIEYSGNVGKAFRSAYGDHCASPAARGRQLLLKPAIVARIRELSEANKEYTLMSLQDHLGELADIRDLAKGSGMYKVAMEAEVNRGKAAGLYTSKGEDIVPPLPADHNLNQLAGRLTGLLRQARSENQDGEIVDVQAREVGKPEARS